MNIAIPVSTSKTQFYLNMTYVEYVSKCDMTPVLVTPGHKIEDVVNWCDGLLLPGGIDVDPIYYGEDNQNSNHIDPEKDAFERSLFHIFREAGKPVFGICRGLQLIAREFIATKIAEGAKIDDYVSFCQHIEYHNQVNDQSLNRTSCQHFVNYMPNKLYNLQQEKAAYSMPVNSMHHQCLMTESKCIKDLRSLGFDITAWTARGVKRSKVTQNLVIEGFSISNWGSKVMAVQWHPEELSDALLLKTFFTRQKNINNFRKCEVQ